MYYVYKEDINFLGKYVNILVGCNINIVISKVSKCIGILHK